MIKSSNMHSFKKLVGLIILYAIIIVGIFVIQFRSDSIIRKNIHGIRVTLAQIENGNGNTGLKNNFQVSYGGIMLRASENSPVVYFQNGTAREAKLVSFEERSKNVCALNFENGIKLVFALSNDDENPTFLINADMPEGVESVNINFEPTSGYLISERKSKSFIFSGKKSDTNYSLTAPALKDGVLTLQSNMNSAYYALVIEQSQFSLDNIESVALASREIYLSTIKSLSETLVSEFINSAQSDASFASSLNEQTVISFLAEMAAAGRYNEGLNTVPTQFVSGNRRTFLSSPFLGGMAATMPTLTMQVENFNNLIARAVQEQTLDIFTVQNIAPYMYTQGNRGYVAQLVRMPASLTELNLTVENAAGIIRTYTYFKEQGSSMAAPLEPVLELCAQKIIESASFEGEKLVLKQNEVPLSNHYDAAAAGDALIAYGQAFEESKIEHVGYLIVNSYLGDTSALDIRVLGEVYPVLIHDNNFYPHFELLRTLETGNVWAYTIASDINYNRDANLTISLDIDFPVGLSHYIFVTGIAPFRRIQIYNMDFRTDARFETYNSSGYVYRIDFQTLLLKSRQREKHEIVRLYYQSAAPAPEPETETAAETAM